MREPFPSPVAGRVWTIPAAILLLAGLFPPETRPESAIGCALLLALGAVVLWVARLDGAHACLTLLATASAAGLLLLADSPGVLLLSWSRVTLAVAAAWILFCLPKAARSGPWLVAVLAFTGTVAALHAVVQRFWGLPALAQAIRQGALVPDAELILVRAEVGRAYAAFATPAALGGYLVVTISVLAAAAWSSAGTRRWLLCGLVFVQLGGLACSESVTAFASAFGAVGLAACCGKLPRRAALALVALVALAVAGIFLARGREVLDVGGEDTPWSLRAKNFRVAAEMIEDHPWTGVGPGAFGERYPAYRRPGDNESRYAHNLPLQLAAELGLPLGGCAALGFFVLFLGPVLRRSAGAAPVERAIEIGTAAFALQNLADFTAYLPSLLWTAVMLRAAIARREARPWAWSSRIPAAVAVALTVAATGVALGAARAEQQEWQGRLSMAVGDRVDALRRTERAARLAPWDADHWLALGQLRAAEPDDDGRRAALGAVDRAVRLAPHRAAARDLRGRIRFALGDWPGAHVDALDAVRLYPMSEDYASRLREVEAWLARSAP